MLIDLEMKTGHSFLTQQSIESVVTEHVPAEDWKGAYNTVAVPAVELRRKLLAMTVSDGSNGRAARYLNSIDKLRDDYGRTTRRSRATPIWARAGRGQSSCPNSEPLAV